MQKNIKTGRNKYLEDIKPYKANIQALLKREEAKRNAVHIKGPESAKARLQLVDDMLNIASNYLVLNGISLSVLKLNSDDALNEARKYFTKALVYMEETVTPFVDEPYSRYEEKLAEINFFDAKKRYNIIKNIGLILYLTKEAFGNSSKSMWFFVELEGRYAAVAKNILNLKTAVANTDPRAADYEPTMKHIRLIKKLLNNAADRYREKYELSTNHSDDFNMGINFLNALKRIHNIFGEKSDAESVKKKVDTWSGKLDADQKQKK